MTSSLMFKRTSTSHSKTDAEDSEILSIFFTLARLVVRNPMSLKPREVAGARKTYCYGAGQGKGVAKLDTSPYDLITQSLRLEKALRLSSPI